MENKQKKLTFLKFDQVYTSQVYILVEWHAGIPFHHLMQRNLMFHKNGYFKTTEEYINRTSQKERIENIEKMTYNPSNLYMEEDNNQISFSIENEKFKGTLVFNAIIGDKIKLGKYTDGIVQDTDEIYTIIE